MALAPTLRSAAVVLGAANLAQYHIQLTRSEAAGQPTWRAAQSAARSSWARFVRETSGWLYAIQTLRNAITASTFLASTVLTLFTVTMGYLSNSMSKSFEWLVLLRFSATGFLLLCSSYSFLQSARYMTHAGFMFPVARDPGDGKEEICLSDDPDELCLPTPVSEEALGAWKPKALYVLTPKSVEVVMAKSELCQWSGLRFLYLAITGVVWIFGGELAFLGATLLMRNFLAGVDRPPALAEIQTDKSDGGAGYAI
jgi:hypothetical protein